MEEIDIYTYGNHQITIPTPNNNITVIKGYPPISEDESTEPEDPQPHPQPTPQPDPTSETFQLKLINYKDTNNVTRTTLQGPHQSSYNIHNLKTEFHGIRCYFGNESYGYNFDKENGPRLKEVNFNLFQVYNFKKRSYTYNNHNYASYTEMDIFDTPENLRKLINLDTDPYIISKLTRVGTTINKADSSLLNWTNQKPTTTYVCGYSYNEDKLTFGTNSNVTADIYININLQQHNGGNIQGIYFFNDTDSFILYLNAIKTYNLPIIGFSQLTNTISPQQ